MTDSTCKKIAPAIEYISQVQNLIKMAKKAAVDALFVKSKVREYIKSKGCNTSGDLIDGNALNDAIVNVLDNAIGRAKANGRKTVQEKDL